MTYNFIRKKPNKAEYYFDRIKNKFVLYSKIKNIEDCEFKNEKDIFKLFLSKYEKDKRNDYKIEGHRKHNWKYFQISVLSLAPRKKSQFSSGTMQTDWEKINIDEYIVKEGK